MYIYIILIYRDDKIQRKFECHPYIYIYIYIYILYFTFGVCSIMYFKG